MPSCALPFGHAQRKGLGWRATTCWTRLQWLATAPASQSRPFVSLLVEPTSK